MIMTDTQLINDLGGPTKVAAMLGIDKPCSVQRVQNWLTRGIPAQVKVNYPHLFLNRAGSAELATPDTNLATTENVAERGV